MLLVALLIAAASGQDHPAAMTRSTIRTCYLAVDGKTYVNGRCRVFPLGGHSYTINTWDRGKPRSSHFAQINETRLGRGTATWNRDPGDDKADDPLGMVRWQKGCWINTRVRICAR